MKKVIVNIFFIATSLASFAQSFQFVESATEIPNNETDNGSIDLYPVPATEMVNLAYTVKNSGDVIINVVDMTGRIVKFFDIKNKNPGRYVHTIETKDLVKGIYIVNVNLSHTGNVKRLVIQ